MDKIKELFKKFKTTIAVLIALIGGSTGAYLGFAPTSGYSEYLTKTLSKTDTTIYVSSLVDDDGIPLNLSYDNKGYFTIDPGQNDAERIVCSGNTSNALTNCVRGLPASGSSETGSSTLAHSHDIGSKIVMTNISQFYNNYMNLWDNQTASGTKTFVVYPKLQSYYAPTIDEQFATKKYVDGVALSGAPDMSTTTKGNAEMATPEEAANGTLYGGTGAELVLGAYMVATSSQSDYKIIMSKNNGKLDQSFLDLNEDFSFNGGVTMASTTITGTITINNSSVVYPTASSSIASKGYVDVLSVKNDLLYASTSHREIWNSSQEETVFEKTISANTLNTIITETYFSKFSDNGVAGNTSIKLYYGSGSITFSDDTGSDNSFFKIKTIITKINNNKENIVIIVEGDVYGYGITYGSLNIDNTQNQTLKLTVNNTLTTGDDYHIESSVINLLQ